MYEIDKNIDSKSKTGILKKVLLIVLILVIFNPYSLYFLQLLIGGIFLSSVQETFNNFRCKITSKSDIISEVRERDLNEHFVIPCASSKGWLDDKKVVLEMVQHHGYAFNFASPKLKNDRDIVLAAVKDGAAIYLGTFDNDKELVLEAVRKRGQALKLASPKLKNDQEVYFEAMKNYPWALEYASPEIKDNREIVLEAVKRDWGNIRYASLRLQADPEIMSISKKR